MNFLNENLLTNGSFETEIGAEWGYWQQPASVVVQNQNIQSGTYSFDITGGGDDTWAIQFFQEGIDVVEGTTYRLSIVGSASVARNISVAVGYGDPFIEYAYKGGIALTTSSSTQDFVFTVTKPSAEVKVVLELGQQTGFANGVVTLDQVRLQRLDAEPLVSNSDFSLSGWRGFGNTWHGTAFTTAIIDGEFKMTVTSKLPDPEVGSLPWHLQITQDAESLAGTGIPDTSSFLDLSPNTTYELKFDAYASEAVTITPNIFGRDIWTNFVQNPATTLTTSKNTYTLSVVTGATLNNTEKLAFEFGTGLTITNNVPVSVYLDNVTLKASGVDVPSLYNGNMETVLGGHAIDGPATLVNTSEGALMTVNSMGAPHVPHYFYTFASLEKGDYRVKFVIKGDVARTIRFNVILPDESYRSILPEGFKDFNIVDDETYVFTTSFTVATPLTNVKVEVDFGDLGANSTSVVGSFLITELLVYRDYNS
jgi:hypothetical protein